MTIYTTGEVDAQALAMLLKERDELRAKNEILRNALRVIALNALNHGQSTNGIWAAHVAYAELGEKS
jgi:predicted DNA-binding ribbon-helix-helix protein